MSLAALNAPGLDNAVNLSLSIHGVTVSVTGPQALLASLSRAFSYFQAAPNIAAFMRLDLRLAPFPAFTASRSWRWNGARIARHGAQRVIDYGGDARLVYDFNQEAGLLISLNERLLNELAYLTILSRVGKQLDASGQHRVHALGFTFQGNGGLVVLPSGGGKSRLAFELLRRPGFQLLSDDTPLLSSRTGRLSAFPLGLGLRPGDETLVPERWRAVFERRRFGRKHVVDLDYFPGAVAGDAPLRWVFLGGRSHRSHSDIRRCSSHRAFLGLAAPLVIGLGTPQVLEMMAPSFPWLRDAVDLSLIGLNRIAAAARAARMASCSIFKLGESPSECAVALEAYLRT